MILSYFNSHVWVLPAIFLLLGPIGITQQQSGEEASREAGRLGTEAERIRGEAAKQVREGGNPSLLADNSRPTQPHD
ncbi:MAG: hypothetical protein L0220_03405 [Acidobacteria bacterium]|nr:hypothetical protein [Acidobacteriota bacterium]